MAQNVIRAYCNCLESYFGETNVRSLIIEKPNVWSPIIANFSNSSDYPKECDSATDQVIRLARKEARELVMKKESSKPQAHLI